MAENRLIEVQSCGQSIWMDFIVRSLISSGKLQRLVDDGIVGMTSNPTIFAKAIGDTQEYDAAVAELLDLDAGEIYERLAIEDIRGAADVLRSVYERTNGEDGYISLEVSPLLAYDTEGTLNEAKRLFATVDRPNVMIKIPGTEQGLPAIEEAIAAGINVNVTLLFSVENYIDVAHAYVRGLTRRLEAGQDVSKIASVASFFLSRIDTVVDNILDSNIRSGRARGGFEHSQINRDLMGKAAIANAKMAYMHFQEIFEGEQFARLRDAGARVQRPLWASTSTKNPALPDTYYVDSLIGPHTVNTLPPVTIEAFKTHGTVARTVDQGLDEARDVLQKLAEVGVQMDKVTQQLQSDGVESFANDFRRLMDAVEAKRQIMLTGVLQRQDVAMAQHEPGLRDTLSRIEKDKILSCIWTKDPSTWKEEFGHQQVISERLGWLDVVNADEAFYAPLNALREDVRQRKYSHLLLLGMGGSSLAAEVMRQTFGVIEGFPNLIVLDTTDPQSIRMATETIDLDNTLFIVSTKSGGTIETVSLFRYYYGLVEQKHGASAGEQFCAITDPGSELEALAHEKGFKYLFLNPTDIGGRYSVLSYFGLVPAAAMGLDVDRLLENARRMATACGPIIPASSNPAAWLGVVMGYLTEQGVDKFCIVASPEIDSFGLWAEQLVAESTGKEGRGVIPVASVVPDDPRNFDDDQFFVYLRLDGPETELDKQVNNLKLAGMPVMTLHLSDPYDLGGEFFRWELATAVAGYMLHINPFDQPNVAESKENTKVLLDYLKANGDLPSDKPIVEDGGLKLYADAKTVAMLRRVGEQRGFDYGDLVNLLLAHIGLARSGDYIAIMAYLAPTERHQKLLDAIREELRHATTRAVTLGYGPRFLHSTGQLHKGGPNKGVFIQITVENNEEIPIPGEPYDFMMLKRAQAQGDLQALQNKGRRMVRFHLPEGTVSAGLERVLEAIREAAAQRRGW
ncbi:MAG TPA: bifunctional transaldolase/phosoglucose isomerase [Aggregatilinea sp.]|uniref:bifunctional transaldolase/phosoglucose isomerase n=1 Tax=Aggregatilinea sp. TaxID=2806333 RepID=UPI002B83FA5B|nr:bifunctional transaldolase/phosoglucose isomerase [Aggregatilinea sp.]HML20378.1 bifunctional transaldolase/phosoglucose isomerase [Aggregatilinea sp.]